MIPKPISALLTAGIMLPAIFAMGRAGRGYRRRARAIEFLPPAERDAWQLARIRELVGLAGTRSPYYRQAFAEAGVTAKSLTDLTAVSALPLLDKDTLRAVPVADFQVREPRPRRSVVTAGSTGKPVEVVHDLQWWARSLARRADLYADHGFRLGSREARFWGRGARPRKLDPKILFGNRQVFQFLGADETAQLEEMAELRDFRPDYAYGYASLILAAAHLDVPPPAAPGLRGIVSTAEMMTPSQAAAVSAAFGCPVINEYGCSELDIIAFDCPEGACHVQSNHVLLEAVPDGTGRNEAVVTDLDNDVMPLIRYRLGDYLELDCSPCACGRTSPIVRAIQGRTVGQILQLPDGARTHAVCFAYLMEELSDRSLPFTHFRVHQESPSALRYVVAGTPAAAQDDLRRTVIDETRSRVAQEFAITVEFGDIPRTPGQKYTYFVPLPEA